MFLLFQAPFTLYGKISIAVAAIAAIVGYVFLRNILKLPKATISQHSLSWNLEGLAMEHITLLVLLKELLAYILGVLYLFCTILAVIISFQAFVSDFYYELADKFKNWAIIFFLAPIAIRLAFEIIWIFFYKCLKYIIKAIIFIAKLLWKIFVAICRFVWNFFSLQSAAVLSFISWINAMLTQQIEKNNKKTEEIKNGNSVFYAPSSSTKSNKA